MSQPVTVPQLGESVTEATIGEWLKKPGETVAADEPVASLETDKVAVEVLAPMAGVMGQQLSAVGETVAVGATIANIEAGSGAGASASVAPASSSSSSPEAPAATDPALTTGASTQAAAPPSTGAGTDTTGAPEASPAGQTSTASGKDDHAAPQVGGTQAGHHVDAAALDGQPPSIRRAMLETGVELPRVTKQDVLAKAKEGNAPASAPVSTSAERAGPSRREERVKMTRLRQTIARRLKEAQDTAAMLTTFNDVDMTAVMDARAAYKESFEKKHGVKLGFMGFFTKAACLALKDIPAVNGRIEGDEIVYNDFMDISVAVSGPSGLVVPVIRNAEAMSFATIERTIGDFGRRAKDGTLTMADMAGGTFTISNGGVFGSLMSTPIINPPQSAVLGLHRIEDRPVVRDGEVVVRPMMYLALSYDHRLVDGREAVTFLKTIKEAIEDPTRLLIDL